MNPAQSGEIVEKVEEALQGFFHDFGPAFRRGDYAAAARIAHRLAVAAEAASVSCHFLKSPPLQTKMQRCMEWLIGKLGTTSRSSDEIYGEGVADEGYSESTIRRCLRRLGATYKQIGNRKGKYYLISLPENYRNILAGAGFLTGAEVA